MTIPPNMPQPQGGSPLGGVDQGKKTKWSVAPAVACYIVRRRLRPPLAGRFSRNDLVPRQAGIASMKNAIAVYTPASPMKGSKLLDVASEGGIQVRFLALGGYIPSDPAAILSKPLTSSYAGGLLLAGSLEVESESLTLFDQFVAKGDRTPIAEMLKGGTLAWCELYAGRFNYADMMKPRPKMKGVRGPSVDRSLSLKKMPWLREARTRYIFYNQSRRKNGQDLIARLSDLVAAATKGVAVEHHRPS